jgi:hypothetical protein
MAASTLMSRPQQTLKFPVTAVTGAFMSTSRNALNVSVVGPPLAVQLTAWLTMISPLPAPGSPGVVLMSTLLVTNSVESAGPVMLSPGAEPMMKSCGSIVQVPVRPLRAAVVSLALGAT